MYIFIAYVQLDMVYVTNNDFWLWACETINDPPHFMNARQIFPEGCLEHLLLVRAHYS